MGQNEVNVQIQDMNSFQNFIYSGDMYLLYAVFIFMAIDILTGLAKAFKKGNLWSTKSVYGTGRKVLSLSVIIVVNIIDNILGLNGVLVIGLMYYYIATEGLSILENLTEMNVPFPAFIKDKLQVMKDESQEKEG